MLMVRLDLGRFVLLLAFACAVGSGGDMQDRLPGALVPWCLLGIFSAPSGPGLLITRRGCHCCPHSGPNLSASHTGHPCAGPDLSVSCTSHCLALARDRGRLPGQERALAWDCFGQFLGPEMLEADMPHQSLPWPSGAPRPGGQKRTPAGREMLGAVAPHGRLWTR